MTSPAADLRVAGLQTALEHSERLRALGDMAAAQAHHLNNVLGNLVSHIEVIRLDPSDVVTVRECADGMLETCRRAAAVIRILSEFARPVSAGHAERLDLNRIAAEVLRLMEPVVREHLRVRGAAVTLELREGRPPPITGRTTEVRQILLNLVQNALEAQTGAGRIVVSTDGDHGAAARLTVADEGPGVDPGLGDRIWEPFFTTKPAPAAGLGLAVVRGLVGRMGGRAGLAAVDRGACFEVTLPATP
jgi:signal transduction histidine kinase